MKKGGKMPYRTWIVVVMLLALSLLWSIGLPPETTAGSPGALCVVTVAADGQVLGVLTNRPINFSIAVLILKDEAASVPVACAGLNTLSLAVANQEDAAGVFFVTQVFTNKGEEICTKGPFAVDVNGARGVTYTSCVEDVEG